MEPMSLPLGLALTGLALMILAMCLQRHWNKNGALSGEWVEFDLAEHEKRDRRAARLF